MVIVTLVGEKQAKVGNKIIYRGPLSDCRDCKRKTVCFNLDENALYEITALRDKHHECNIHEGGVRVVEMRKAPVESTIDAKLAIEGSMVNMDKDNCLNIGCRYYVKCYPIQFSNRKKYKVIKVLREIRCPETNSLKMVVLEQ